ncbi:MAG TPA: methyltransferase domain-containing protein [Kofleriaceae bacterium]|nr:methyltransferase domain-containing protein [Kofleriaceae bacterium]
MPPPPIDFGKAAADYARHRQGFPPRFYDALAARRIGLPGQRIVDLGTGTGTVARALADRGAIVTGVDVSESLLAQAKALDPRPTWLRAPAEDTRLPDHAFDAVTAAQCWHWFDRGKAAAEAKRLLAPKAPLVIAHLDWISDGGVLDDTVALIEQTRGTPLPVPGAGGNGFYPTWPDDVRRQGLTRIELFGFDHELIYTHEAWRGRIRASAGVGATMSPEDVARFDHALAELLAARYSDPVPVLHRIFVLIAEVP